MITLMMEAASTYETSINFYQTTRRNNPEDSHIQSRNSSSFMETEGSLSCSQDPNYWPVL
jgi:hypothetical protein